MDKLYYLLQCHQLLLGHPTLPNLRADIADALVELEVSAKAKREKEAEAAKAEAAPKAVPNPEIVGPAETNTPVIERKI